MRSVLLALLLGLTGCAATPPVVTPCEAPEVPTQPDYPLYRLKADAPDDATALAFYESFSMCRTHAENLEGLLNALKR